MISPWEAEPYRLWTWWTMEKFSAHFYFSLGAYIQSVKTTFGKDETAPIEKGALAKGTHGYKVFMSIRDLCDAISLQVAKKCVDDILSRADGDRTTREFIEQLTHLERTIQWEMEDKLFMFISADRAAFYDQPELFGKDVNSKFPTIQFDIVEAGNCYAAGRGTATVFHLMRIMERGVQEFGTKLGVVLTHAKNWQPILDEVNKKIRALPPRDPSTPELSEIAASLYAVKLAWRNEVMHPNDTYTLEEAYNLIQQVKIFMRHLVKFI